VSISHEIALLSPFALKLPTIIHRLADEIHHVDLHTFKMHFLAQSSPIRIQVSIFNQLKRLPPKSARSRQFHQLNWPKNHIAQHKSFPFCAKIPHKLAATNSPKITTIIKDLSSMVQGKQPAENSTRQRRDPPSSKSISAKSISSLKSINSNLRMKIIPIRALQDNYMYLLIDESTRHAAAIDPVNASAIATAVHDHGVELKAVLTTHHHYDHANGNADMLGMYPEITIYGGDSRVQALTKSVNHGDTIKLGSLNIECLSTPCHTKGHICYYVTCDPDPLGSNPGPPTNGALASEKVVFTGDTLFVAGCGRFFEGSPEQMDYSLNVILGNLPPDTKVYCGHEYTVANLKFALSVEPQNVDIKSKLNWAQNRVAKKEPTIPSTIADEKKTNPFMRLKRSSVKKYTGEQDELEVMAVLRHRKNEFQA